MKENLNIGNQKSIHHQLLILLESTAYQQEFYFTSELFFFLIQYSFLFSHNDTDTKTCNLKTTHFLIPQENGENGARYLDPKYSRWLSTDPALGEYVPAAGKGNANDADNLPGMGGIFNSENLSLYHYAGNNPVKYVDPDGREEYDSTITYEQWEMIPGCTFESFLDSEKKLAGKTWQETQEFFNQYPNGRIYRNPDEGFYSYNYYTNEGKDKPHYYNMYTADELFIWGIGKGFISLVKGIGSLASKTVATTATKEAIGIVGKGISREAQKTTYELIDIMINKPQGYKMAADQLLEMAKTGPSARHSILEINKYAHNLINLCKDEKAVRALKTLIDVSFSLGE